MRTCPLFLLLMLPTSLTAQAPDWTWRLDHDQVAPAAASDTAGGQWVWQQMPPGWHLTTTAQGVTLFPTGPERLTGRWAVEMEFFLFPDPGSAGVGVALAQPAAPGLGELCILLRRDGQMAVVVGGPAGEHLLVGWTADTAADAHRGDEVKPYVLRVEMDSAVLSASVNGRRMLTLPLDPNHVAGESVAGIRIGPALNVHVARFDLVKPLAPAAK